jgi:hypothetical protein
MTSSTIKSQRYLIGENSLLIKVEDFVQSPDCLKSVIYSASLAGGIPLPEFITFFPQTQKFSISSNSNSDAGTYALVVTGTVINDDSSNLIKYS